jgi:predicted PurR-regulated permease PerM
MRPDSVARSAFLLLLVGTTYLMYVIFKPFLPGILWAVVLTVAFYPVYLRLVEKFHGRSWAASGLLSVLVAAFIVVPAVLAAVKVGQAAVKGYAWLEAQQGDGGDFFSTVGSLPWVVAIKERVGQYVDLSQVNLRSTAIEGLRNLGQIVIGKTRTFVTSVFGTLVTVFVALLTMTVLFHEGTRLVQYIRRILPLGPEDKEAMLRLLEGVTRSVFFGALATALLQGVLGGIGFAVVGLPAAVTFGALMFFCALLPTGTVLVWGPAVIWLFIDGHPVKALILLIWGAAVVSTADNIVRPYLVGRGVKVHTLLVFFGILGGIVSFGLIGVFLGPIVISLFFFLLEVARRDFLPASPGGTA